MQAYLKAYLEAYLEDYLKFKSYDMAYEYLITCSLNDLFYIIITQLSGFSYILVY